jgi:hypothetical protein
VSNSEPGSSKSNTGLIIGVVVGVTILGLITVLSILYWRHKKKMSEIDEGALLYYLSHVSVLQLNSMNQPIGLDLSWFSGI